jgi:hypothetical protein
MQEPKPPPVPPVQPATPVTPATPGFTLLNELHNLFIRKAALREQEAYALLHPQPPGPASITDSLGTGKLTKFIRYIRTGIPPLAILAFTCSQVL